MKPFHKSIFTSFAFLLTPAGSALAQDPPSFTSVEGFTCSYNKGKGPSDLAKVNVKWNAWADGINFPAYNAWNLTPNFVDSGTTMDVVWLGAWQNGIDMGKGLDLWKTKGSKINTEYGKVVTCGEHSNFASYNIRMPDMSSPSTSGVVTFSDCSLEEGKSMADGMAAVAAWAKHLDSTGSKSGMWVFFPALGTGDTDWDFKMVESHRNYASLGHDWEDYGNKQGYAKAQAVFTGVMECGGTRVYDSEMVRNGGLKPG